MMGLQGVALTQIIDAFQLKPVYKSHDIDRIRILQADISRPGLQLAGYFTHFDPNRVQILGLMENSFLDTLQPDRRRQVFARLFDYRIPVLIIARGLTAFPECLEMAERFDITVLQSGEATTEVATSLISFLKVELAPSVTRHGVLVEVYGEGVLITGESGIGKSEAAVELLKRGHRLVADDAVEIRRVGTGHLIGQAPELIRHYIEIRGIGVINVAQLFGMGSVKSESDVDLNINIVPWNSSTIYDRLGVENHYTDILGVNVPTMTIPVKPGRNLAVIVEVAAMETRQKKMGFNAAQEFTDRINQYFDQQME